MGEGDVKGKELFFSFKERETSSLYHFVFYFYLSNDEMNVCFTNIYIQCTVDRNT